MGIPLSLNFNLLWSHQSSFFGVGFGLDTEMSNTVQDQRLSMIIEPEVRCHSTQHSESIVEQVSGLLLGTSWLGLCHVRKNDPSPSGP